MICVISDAADWLGSSDIEAEPNEMAELSIYDRLMIA